MRGRQGDNEFGKEVIAMRGPQRDNEFGKAVNDNVYTLPRFARTSFSHTLSLSLFALSHPLFISLSLFLYLSFSHTLFFLSLTFSSSVSLPISLSLSLFLSLFLFLSFYLCISLTLSLFRMGNRLPSAEGGSTGGRQSIYASDCMRLAATPLVIN